MARSRRGNFGFVWLLVRVCQTPAFYLFWGRPLNTCLKHVFWNDPTCLLTPLQRGFCPIVLIHSTIILSLHNNEISVRRSKKVNLNKPKFASGLRFFTYPGGYEPLRGGGRKLAAECGLKVSVEQKGYFVSPTSSGSARLMHSHGAAEAEAQQVLGVS